MMTSSCLIHVLAWKIFLLRTTMTAFPNNNAAATNTMKPSSSSSSTTSIYYEDDHLLIRRINPETDLQAVHDLFRQGMLSVVPTAFRIMVQAPIFLTVSSLTAILTHGLTKRLVERMIQKQPPPSSSSSLLPHGMAWTASVLSVGGCLVMFRQFVAHIFHQYIHNSLKDDLCRIPDVYLAGRGTFLVAVQKRTSTIIHRNEDETSIVGCIGGQEHHSDQENDNVPLLVFELRRMSVSDKCRRQGLGRKLVQTLEQHIIQACTANKKTSPPPSIRMFLTCSNAQPAAHRLYESCGYTLVKYMAYTYWLYLNGFSIRKYERTLITNEEASL